MSLSNIKAIIESALINYYFKNKYILFNYLF